jgi:hypothetical protein
MKLPHAIISSAALACLAVSVLAATNDVSDAPTSAEKRKSLSVTTNDVVLIKAASGAVAVVQFTSFGPDTGSYRWRYRSAKAQATTTGRGQTRESYNHKPKADGGYDVTPKADHDTTVRAGDLSLEWSYGSTTNGWLYYHPSRATIQVLNTDAFDRDL